MTNKKDIDFKNNFIYNFMQIHFSFFISFESKLTLIPLIITHSVLNSMYKTLTYLIKILYTRIKITPVNRNKYCANNNNNNKKLCISSSLQG